MFNYIEDGFISHMLRLNCNIKVFDVYQNLAESGMLQIIQTMHNFELRQIIFHAVQFR